MGIPTGLSLTNKAWWEADSGAYSDAGTTLAVNNSTVQQWTDQVSGITLSQATAGNRPTYKTGQQNGLPAIQFVAGSATHLDQASFTQTQALTAVWLGKIAAGTYIFDANANSSRVIQGLDLQSGSATNMSINAGTTFESSLAFDVTAYHLTIAVFSGTASFLMSDGLPILAGMIGSTTTGTNGMTSLRLGARYDATGPSSMFTAAFGIFGGAATAKDIVALGSQLGPKYGLTLIPQNVFISTSFRRFLA